MLPSLKGWILLVILSSSFKKKIQSMIGSASTDAADTWSNLEDNCEDTRCVSCKRGFYGEGNCNRICNQNCMLGYCNFSNGACKYGCVDTKRNSLTSPWYGPSCSENCSSNCRLGRCFRNGTCYLGCQDGTYGDMCENACPENCFQICKMKSGECLGGCQSGFYGQYCELTCSVNCLNGRCHQNGKCQNCIEGFQGDTCYNKCPKHCKSCKQYGDNCTSCIDGRYGHKCIGCDKCRSKCRFSDGKCIDGCKDGYHGDYCSVSCNSGCHPSVCDQTTGECSLGCIPTMYGASCDQTCSSNCMGSQCQDRSVLECSIGCIAGFWGKYCEHLCDTDCLRCTRRSGLCMECSKNTYGLHCEKYCSKNCFDRKCNNTGTCVSGCITGYHGNNCSLKCSKGCSLCDQKSGSCSKCVAGWTGETCEGFSRTVVFYALMSLLPVSAVLTVILLIVKCRSHRGREKSSMGCCGCYKNTHQTNYSFNIRPRPASYSFNSDEESSPIDTEYEAVPLYLTGVRGDATSHEGPHGNDITGSVSSSATDLDNVTVTSHSRLRASSVAHKSPTIAEACDHRSDTTQCDNLSFSDYARWFKRQTGFYNQFKDLPGGELAPCLMATATTSRRKNRYVNILPYDHSRVKLQSGDGQREDYINASYINGYGKPCFYIATQGPLQDTVPEFWNLVLQTRAPTIVMLTNLHENGKVKCSQYWPDLESVHQYGDLRVQTIKEMARADYTCREFSISQKGQNDVQSLVHYHYTAWPDNGQAVDRQSLLNFHTEVKRTCGAGPLVVHCSTGVGRTGTFIALDYLLDQAAAEGVIDVFECVKRLRYQRMNMVHNQGEYEVLHDVLALALQPKRRPTEDNSRCQDVE